MTTVLTFDELGVGQQLTLNTADRGAITGVAQDFSGGGSGGFQVVEVTNANHTFNGDGSGGGVQIFPMTIVRCQTIDASTKTWKLDDVGGVANGWIVAMNIEGADPGAVNINDEDDTLMASVTVLFPDGTTNDLPYPVFYYFNGWWLLRSRILVP
jgi:hypothetical protein